MQRTRLVFLLCAACVGRGDERGASPRSEATLGNDSTATGDPEEEGDPEPVEPPEVIVTVCPDGAADHTTLQAAIEAAPEGAVVQACNATFFEPLVVEGRTVTLRGEPGTVLDAGGESRGLLVTSGVTPGRVTVEGLTITNGGADRGGAVLCEGAELVLHDVVVSASRASTGGGVASTDCIVELVGVELFSNTAGGEGGGGHLVGGTVTVARSRVAANSGADGGGLLIRGAAGHVEDSVFEDNVGHVGGGLWFDGGLRVSRNQFRRNDAMYTGGGFAGDLTTGEVTDNEVYENTSNTDGGGGFTRYGGGRIAGNHFHHNVSGDDAGGLRMLYGRALVEDNLFTANAAAGAGGAMKVSHAEGHLRANTFEDNVAGGDGGAVEIDDDVSFSSGNIFRRNHAGTDGGGLHMSLPYWHLAMEDSVFEDNVADQCGGGVAMAGKTTSKPHTLTSARLVFSGNQASDGAGMCVRGGAFELDNAIFVGNQGAGDGGGLLVEGADVALRNVVFHGNQGGSGSALAFLGVGEAHVSEASFSDESVRVDASLLDWRYNLHWGTTFGGMRDPSGLDGNVNADPGYVDPAARDFRLANTSPGVDAGDPSRRDRDASRVDVGAYGGPGATW